MSKRISVASTLSCSSGGERYRQGFAVARPSGIRATTRMHENPLSCKRNLCIGRRNITVTQAVICSLYIKASESILNVERSLRDRAKTFENSPLSTATFRLCTPVHKASAMSGAVTL